MLHFRPPENSAAQDNTPYFAASVAMWAGLLGGIPLCWAGWQEGGLPRVCRVVVGRRPGQLGSPGTVILREPLHMVSPAWWLQAGWSSYMLAQGY